MAVTQGLCIFKYSQFTDKRELGKGEFGVVYSAAYPPNFQKVAIRIISRGYRACGSLDTQTLKMEAKTLHSIVAENVIKMWGVVIEPEHLCLVLEYARYGSLDKILRRANKEMDLSVKIKIAHDVVRGMCCLHGKQIVHSRLKCSCIFVTEGMHGKIGDVCMGGNKEITSWTTIGRSCSRALRQPIDQDSYETYPLAYQPPECVIDINMQPDMSGDVYAYGIILWELYTGKIAYGGMSEDKIYTNVSEGFRLDATQVPGEFRQLVERCWSRQRENRPPSEDIEKELKPAVLKYKEEMIKAVRKCEALLDEFDPDFQNIHAAPEGDMASFGRISHEHHSLATHGDGIAFPVPHEDRKISSEPVIQPPVGNKTGRGSQGEATSTGNDSRNAPAEKKSPIAKPEHFYTVAEHLGARRWRRFGCSLGFSEGQLDNIDANYSRAGYPEIPYQMLREWKEGASVPITVAYLVEVLRDQGLHDVAQKLDPY